MDKKKHLKNNEEEEKKELKINVADNYELIPDAESLGKRARYLSKTSVYKKDRKQPYKKTKKSTSD